MRPITMSGEDLLKVLTGGLEREKPAPIADEVEARVLRDLLGVIRQPMTLQVGDLVRQREHFDCYTFGRKVCIVSHLFYSPNLSHGTETAELRNDMIVLVRVGDKHQPQEFAVQSWRFERYVGPVSPL